jgi:eukaryotic-like serine/threonine-protein kinase
VENPSNDPTVLAGSDDLTGKAVGRFQITALLGKGGMGEVYLAEDSLLKRSVALKRVSASLRSNPQYRELLLKEAERASRLNDEHVAHVHDVLEHQGEIFVVMEYVKGQSLRQRTGQPLPLSEFLPIAVQCVEALVAAHQSGIAHRDIKPENIMITAKGRVKVCDFGLARQGSWAQDTAAVDKTPTMAFRGTPAYMSPEALLNRHPDFRADMFSLGIVFYELLAGQHPFRDDDNPIVTADRIIHAEPKPLLQICPALPKALSDVVDKMLRKDPEERYANPSELLWDLQRTDVGSSDDQKKRSRILIPALLLILIMLSIPALVILTNRKTTLSPDLPMQPILVVLPFRTIGGPAESRFYSDGLTEAVTADLARLADPAYARVVPASEIRIKRVGDGQEARRQFGADLVLAGTLYESGTFMRFTYSLYDAVTLHQFKADAIGVDSSKAFELEDQLVDAVLAEIGIPGKSPLRPLAGSHRTSTTAAYGLYLQGRGYLQNPDAADHLQTAMQSFQRAAELDPSYTAAYAALGGAYWSKYQTTKEPVWIELAREACEKADNLDANAAQSKICLGTVESGTGQYERAALDFQMALKLDPSNDDAYLGLADAYEKFGNYEAAEKTQRQAIEIKPNYYLGYSRLGQFYLRRARYDDAAALFQKEITLIPNSELAYNRVGAAYIYLGRYDDAITVLQKSIALRPTFQALSNLGSTYLRLRKFDDAVPIFEKGTQMFSKDFRLEGNLARAYFWSSTQRTQAASAYELAIMLAAGELAVNPRNADAYILSARYYAMIGKKQEALNHLANALALRRAEPEYFSIAAVIYNQLGERTTALAQLKKAVNLGWSAAEIESEVEFDNLRQEREFQRLVNR